MIEFYVHDYIVDEDVFLSWLVTTLKGFMGGFKGVISFTLLAKRLA